MSTESTWGLTKAQPHRLYCPVCYGTNQRNVYDLYNHVREAWNEPAYCMFCGAQLGGFMELIRETEEAENRV